MAILTHSYITLFILRTVWVVEKNDKLFVLHLRNCGVLHKSTITKMLLTNSDLTNCLLLTALFTVTIAAILLIDVYN